MSQAIEGKYQHYSVGFLCQISVDWCLLGVRRLPKK
jgi:hypothetical protein